MRDLAKFSPRAATTARTLKLKIREKAFADLLAMGWAEFDAYIITLYSPAYTTEVNKRMMNDLILNNPQFDKYLKSVKKKAEKAKTKDKDTEDAHEEEVDIYTELTKEQQLQTLLIARKKHQVGSKEWLDITKLIADITQAKKDEIKEEDTTIHYYLPLSCRDCSLFIRETQQSTTL